MEHHVKFFVLFSQWWMLFITNILSFKSWATGYLFTGTHERKRKLELPTSFLISSFWSQNVNYEESWLDKMKLLSINHLVRLQKDIFDKVPNLFSYKGAFTYLNITYSKYHIIFRNFQIKYYNKRSYKS